MAILIDNLNNLFWDNGSWKYPNTYPKLVGGKYLTNVTPIMTSPISGWVILEGEWNYALFNENLYFLKKDKPISLSKNKWRYFLIKDHICSLFRNKANIIVSGTITNIDLKHLNNKDFQFTFPVFNSFNKRILLPLIEERYNWKKHTTAKPIDKRFRNEFVFGNEEYTDFLNTLKANKELFNTKGLKPQEQKQYKYFTLLGKTNRAKKGYNWKNQLIEKINKLLEGIKDNPNIVLGTINPSLINVEVLKNKWAITNKSKRSLIEKIEESQQIKEGAIDFSGLEDIVLIRGSDGAKNTAEAYFHINYEDLGGVDRYIGSGTYIKKLTRRVRTPLLSPYTSKAIYRTGDKYFTWFQKKQNSEHLLPQKIFFEINPNLEKPKKEYIRFYPQERNKRVFRSVYLYFCWYLNFTIQYSLYPEAKRYLFKEKDFVNAESYYGGPEECKTSIDCSLSNNFVYAERENEGIHIRSSDRYEDYYPWKAGGSLNIEKPLNIGWLVGQFSPFIEENKDVFSPEATFKVKAKKERLKRIKGLKDSVKGLISDTQIYEKGKHAQPLLQDYKPLNLDIFGGLPPRLKQATLEEDYSIGEKLLFTTWGLPAYLLFQPTRNGDYSNYESNEQAKIVKWLNIAGTWGYVYYVFGADNYLTQDSKNLFKKAYDNFKRLEYKDFYQNKQNFEELEKHIRKNTQAYFESEEITISNTPLKELAVNDIFFSDQEWFFYDDSEGNSFEQEKGAWFTKEIDNSINLTTGDIVVYFDYESGKFCLGETTIWEDKVTLPSGQYIAVGSQIENSSSVVTDLLVKYYKIKKLQEYESIDTIINAVQQGVSGADMRVFNDIADISLDKLVGNTEYLFDLKGTNFYCYLDKNREVHLIFKNTEAVGVVDKRQYTVEGNKDLASLSKTQWINQKVNLSAFGQKLELPIKAFENKVITTIEMQPITEKLSKSAAETWKIEVKHDLGKVYYSLSPLKKTTETAALLNTFQAEELNLQFSRGLQDYVNRRKEYELNLEQMNLGHQKARFEQRQNEINSIVGAAVSTAAGVLTGAVGGVSALYSGLGSLTTNQWVGGTFGAIKGGQSLWNAWNNFYVTQQRGEYLNKQIEMDLQNKAYQSYNIDLSFERKKASHALSMRKLFSQDSYNQINDRERALALDKLEPALQGKTDNEIYLEVWTTSEEQEDRVKDYHEKFGVDCRLPNQKLVFKNGIEEGIYRIEDPEISNLKDFLELAFLKARLEIGIRFIKWLEHEKVEELIPVDPRIEKLQEALKLAERRQIEYEQEKLLQHARNEELKKHLEEDEEKIKGQEKIITSKNEQISTLTNDINKKTKEIERSTQNYHELSEKFSKLEEEKKQVDTALKLEEQIARNCKEKLTGEEQKNKKLETELNKQKELVRNEAQRYSALEQEKNEINSKFTKAEEERLKLEGEKTRLEEAKQNAENEKQKLKAQIEEKERLADEKEKTLKEKLSEVEKIKGEIEKCKQDKKAQEEELTQSKDKLSKLEKEIEEKKREIEANASKIKQQETRINELQTQGEEANKNYQKIQQEKEALSKQFEEQKTKLAELAKFEKEKEALEATKKELTNCKQDLEHKIKDLENEKTKAENNYQTCLKDKEAKEKELSQQLEKAKEDLKTMSEKGERAFPTGYINDLLVHYIGNQKKLHWGSLLLVIPHFTLEEQKFVDSIKVLRWSHKYQIFMEDPYYDSIFIYGGYKLFFVGNSKANEGERKRLIIDDAYWNNYAGSSYFSWIITKWSDIRHHILGTHESSGQKACVNWEQIAFSDDIISLPYIPKSEITQKGKPWEQNYSLELKQPDQRDNTSLSCSMFCADNYQLTWLWDKEEKNFIIGKKSDNISSAGIIVVDSQKTHLPWEIQPTPEYWNEFKKKNKEKEAKRAYGFWYNIMLEEVLKQRGLSQEVIKQQEYSIQTILEKIWSKKNEDLLNYYEKNVSEVNNYGDYRKVLGIGWPLETSLVKKIHVLFYNQGNEELKEMSIPDF